MRRTFVLLALALPLASVAPTLQAQETPEMHLEFIRRLRAKGYNDLALEHIEKLKSVPGLGSVLQLERARTLVAMSRDKDLEKRPKLIEEAKSELDAYLRGNPSGPDAARGRLELARLASYKGQTLLIQALREEDNSLARKAEQQFVAAGSEFDAAMQLLSSLVGKTTTKETDPAKQKLSEELLEARFDRASNLIDQAQTYIDTANDADNRKKAVALDNAKQAYKQIATDGGPIGLRAAAWLVKVNFEGQDPTEAEKYRKRVMDSQNKPAQRLARLFYMQSILKNPTIKLDTRKKYKKIEDEAQNWLKAYPTEHKSWEGWAVRFELAQAMFFEAKSMTNEPNPPGAAALAILNQAQKHLAAIADSDSSLAEKARAFNVAISVMKLGGRTAVADLKDFENCYLKAQVEMDKMRTEKLEDKRKAHLREALKALNRGIMLADAKTSPKNLEDARYLLATGYLLAGDPYRAAVAGEALARLGPPTKRAGQAAGYAIEAYATLWKNDSSDANRQRLHELAEFVLSPLMQKSWAAEPVTPVARYQLAIVYNKDNAYKEAIAQLEKLPADFSGYIYAQGQLVFIAEEAREKAKSDEEKNAFAEAARKAVLRIPNLPPDADPNTAAMYFFAQLELPKFYYADAAAALEKNDLARADALYKTMEKSVAELKANLAQTPAKLSKETRGKIDFSVDVLVKYVRLGAAGLDYRRGDYNKVLQVTAPVEAAVEQKKGDGKGPIRVKDYQVTGDILGLALRAHVQKGDILKAKQLFGYLERLASDEAEGAVIETTNVLRSLIGDLQNQVADLKKANDQAKLRATVKNFSTFLDDLAKKDLNNKDRKLDIRDITFLARCYASLEDYGKAANLFAQVPPPKALNKDPLKDEDEKEVATYWYFQIEYAKALRQSARSRQDLAKAKKVLDRLLEHKNARRVFQAKEEEIHILEDSAKFGAPLYGLAMKGWGEIMNNSSLKSAMANDNNLKELYFNAYFGYNACLYKLSQTKDSIAKSKDKEYLAKAANNILRLERSSNQEGWDIVGPRFRELLKTEKKLRDEYEKLKKTTAK
jgi:hypothetical protein